MGFILAFFGLAFLDSLNPSAIIITFVLLLTARPLTRTATYILGNFLTYLTLGLLVYFGLGGLLQNISKSLTAWFIHYNPYFEHPIALIIQTIVGLYLFILAIKRPNKVIEEKKVDQNKLHPTQTFLLGVGVTFADFLTAAPYIAALGFLGSQEVSTWAEVSWIVSYNLVFIWIPLLLLAIYFYSKEAQNNLVSIKTFTQKNLPFFMKIVFFLGGLALLVDIIAWVFGKSLF